MFGISIILAIVIGYILKGRLKHLINLEFKYIGLIVVGFVLERILNLLIQQGILEINPLTYVLDLLMYGMIFAFIVMNRKHMEFVIMGIGFLMNAIVIFANGGAMPVSAKALEAMGVVGELVDKGLYAMMHDLTRFKILADIIPIHLSKIGFVISIGDIVLCLGMMILIIKGMKTTE
ncbi:MAG: DUF5317 domain-containing protein [Cellulosilyticaceae bacterium]